MEKPGWTFLTNHAQVLLCVAQNQDITAREISTIVGITERAVQRILHDLEEAGYLRHSRAGRGNHYEIDTDMPLRHPSQRDQRISDLLAILNKPSS